MTSCRGYRRFMQQLCLCGSQTRDTGRTAPTDSRQAGTHSILRTDDNAQRSGAGWVSGRDKLVRHEVALSQWNERSPP
jgi:hypothetical protein